MKYKTRRKLFLSFVLIFLLITPPIIFYAAGYKMKLSWPPKWRQTFQKTGMFVFDTEPEGAKIYIDDKLQEAFLKKYFSNKESLLKTPTKIKNLLPGEYNVRLELDGYWPWKKKLTINPGQSTFAEDIYLFKRTLPIKITDAQISSCIKENVFCDQEGKSIIQSPNKKFILIKNADKILVIDEQDEVVTEISVNNEQEYTNIAWTNDDKKIIINKKVIDLNNINSEKDLTEYLPESFNLKWDPQNYNKIYYQEQNKLVLFDIRTKQKEVLIEDQNIQDFIVKDNYIFYITEASKITKIKTFYLKNKEIISNNEIPYSNDYKLINSEHSLLNIYDKKNETLYLLDPFSNFYPLKEVVENIKNAYWLEKKLLLYSNNNEIWTLNLENNQQKILLRIGSDIKGIAWHPSDNYIIYSTPEDINIIELDEREKRNITEIINLKNISNIYLDKKGNKLYFTAKVGNQQGLYKMYIK